MSKSNSTPFFGETGDVNKALPDVIELHLTIAQDPWGYYRRSKDQPISRHTKQSLPRYERCLNPRCQQGGLDLQRIVMFHDSGEYQFHCNGHEGTPQGRRVGDPCDNTFTVTLKVTKKGR